LFHELTTRRSIDLSLSLIPQGQGMRRFVRFPKPKG
jgi:hypothetical protein